jgi:hypothetical protein
MKKFMDSGEFIGKKINVDAENCELEDVILISIEENGILVYDSEEDVNYYILKSKLNYIDDAVSNEEE